MSERRDTRWEGSWGWGPFKERFYESGDGGEQRNPFNENVPNLN